MGYRLLAFDSLASTNDEACRLAQEGAVEGTVVWTQRQTAGRGRRGRRWLSPPGNLYCSLILRPCAAPGVAAQLGFVAALALGDAISEVAPPGVEPRFKWPNDLLVADRKVAGLLLESAGGHGGTLDWLVVGCGLNVTRHPDLTDGFPAISLRAVGGSPTDPYDMLRRFLTQFQPRYAHWLKQGFAALREAWLQRAVRLGAEIDVRLADRRLHGKFVDLDDTGALVLALNDGSREVVSAGDVYF